ncbi:universal stress protein [Chitinophaga silvisoli]|uniref:Universal stress protein n=1 Tax=Chitinophaga silvisoli TaxID=2291814 RepID=A0A3E1P7C0_9BACT|nr:universal stress protein [Chitinophaga silvisoli]RFM35990.1 universal stress protein [Chitinophaga silvisoli]
MSKIMIAVDLSSYTASVIAAGMELARSTKSPVTITSILDKNTEVVPVIETVSPSADELNGRLQDIIAHLETYREHYPDVTVSVTATLGNPKEDILEQAAEEAATMLVIGTHGRTGLDHLLIGSTAEFVIRHASIPVLVVPYRKEKH